MNKIWIQFCHLITKNDYKKIQTFPIKIETVIIDEINFQWQKRKYDLTSLLTHSGIISASDDNDKVHYLIEHNREFEVIVNNYIYNKPMGIIRNRFYWLDRIVKSLNFLWLSLIVEVVKKAINSKVLNKIKVLNLFHNSLC